ncbi:BnaC02g11790D [Brassica napus]|uniref:Calcineurin-like phosphoesterase domain-containing protein n=2 Tax=Brassica TaxID=3705 RepID=A0A3P6DPR5_BRAOL|nr:unnamed protein product [Brassica napus]CDY42236.1 BnaC02g11790D [Brassica napus]VDD21139.1 unnamed protein product [Brassica oleracea]
MSSATAIGKWKHTVLYLTLIISLIYSIESLISHKLHINHNKIRLKRSPNLPLRFRDDGTFKILQVADMHYGMGSITRCRDVLDAEFDYCSDLNTTRFLRGMIEAERPDLIAFTGDNIFGSSTTDAAESLLQAIGPAIEYGIPWAAILGNHDQESTLDRQEVHGAPGSVLSNSTVFYLLFLDSGDRETVQGRRTYGWIKDSQLRWLQDTSKQGDNQSITGNPPALAFFHIPIPEVRDLWYTPFIGQFQEGVACSVVQSGLLQTFVSMGNVKAAFIGHDHVNDFCGNLKGLGKGRDTWTGVERIKTWKRLDDEDLSKIDEQVLWEASYTFFT